MTVTRYGYHEHLVNGYSDGALNGSITAGATSLVVDDGTGLPEAGFFRLLIDDEIIICNRRSGTTVYVEERGAEGTTAASHSDGATVECVITAGALQNYLLRNNHGCTVYTEETTFEDSHGWPIPMGRTTNQNTNLTASNFTWRNQGSSTLMDVAGGFKMRCIREAGINLRGVTIPAPATPYQFTARFRNMVAPSIPTGGTASSHFGLWIRESTTGKITSAGLRPGQAMAMWNWTNWNTFSAIVGTTLRSHDNPYWWVRMLDDGTDHRVFFSVDGSHWSMYGSAWWNQSRTAHLTLAGGDQIGFYLTSADFGGNGAGNNAGSGPAGGMVGIDCFHVEAL